MSSAAHEESYDYHRWHHRARGPWGFWGCGWQQAQWSDARGQGSWRGESWGPGWHGHPFGGPHFIPRPLLIVLMVLGFVWWWPIGLVVLAVMISPKGEVSEVRVISGPDMLRQAAIDSVKTYRFEPYRWNGQPTAVEELVPSVFY